MNSSITIGIDLGHRTAAFAAFDPSTATATVVASTSFQPIGPSSVEAGICIARTLMSWCRKNGFKPAHVFVEQPLARYNTAATNNRLSHTDDGLEGIGALRELNAATRTALIIELGTQPLLIDAQVARKRVANIDIFSRKAKDETHAWILKETGFTSQCQDEVDAAFIAIAGTKGQGARPTFKNADDELEYLRSVDRSRPNDANTFSAEDRELLNRAWKSVVIERQEREACEG